jgi:uncharacterized protein YukE
MIGLPGISSLELVAERLSGLRASLFRRGDPAWMAGDPGGIRRLAEHHGASAGRLDALTGRVRDRVSRVLAGSWQGEASARFAGYWSDLERRLGALAAAHQETADRLEQVADDSARLNREVTAFLVETESWLSRALVALAARDAGAAEWLAGEGMTLVVRWERLLREVEVFAEGIARRLDGCLDFARRPVAVGQRAPHRQPPIDLPPPLPGRALGTNPDSRGPSLMPDRRRAGPGGRRRPLPVRPEVQRRGLRPGTSPDERWPRELGRRRGPQRPPSVPLPRAGSGAGSQPRIKPLEPVLKGGGTTVKVPGTGVPHAPPAGPHHQPGMGPVLTPVDTYIVPAVTLGIFAGKQVKRGIRRLREGKTGGDRTGRK